MKRRRVGSLILATLAISVVGAATRGADAAPGLAKQVVTINRFGHWTLARLGDSALDVPITKTRSGVSVGYRLPPRARQGPTNWYLINLHFRLTLTRSSRGGLLYIGGLTNGRAAAQIKFQITRARAGAMRTVWSTVDYIRGRAEHVTSSRTIEGRFENYLQLKGVRPGRNTLTIQLERFGHVGVERLHIFGDSGITYSPISPAKLDLGLMLPHERVHAGKTFGIGFRITNKGDRDARDVIIGSQSPPDALQRLNPKTNRFQRIDRPVVGTLRFRPRKAGTFRLGIYVRSSANDPGALIEVSVANAPAAGAGWRQLGRVAGGVLLVLGVVLFVLGRRRRRRRLHLPHVGAIVILAALATSGCGAPGDVQKNKEILKTLPTPPGARQTEIVSAPVFTEEGDNAKPVGHTTRVVYRLPVGAKPAALATFYLSRLRPTWRCSKDEEAGPHGRTIIILTCIKNRALVSVNFESIYAVPPQFEVAIDHDGATRIP